eukprot:SM000256S08693  [mRNA]  locus=s256:70015:71834:- [translate_table: standard]
MANSRFEYVRGFEQADRLLPHTWVVLRLDGRAFTRFSQAHGFEKPNDERALRLMNAAAAAVLDDQPDVVFAYGVSDEYSFVLRKTSELYQRRASKLVSVIVSLFAATYVLRWSDFFDVPLQYAPAFDGRAICYPSDSILRHVNNQYNTCFWMLVKAGKTHVEAQTVIKGTQADFKNELLYSQFGLNYNSLPAIFRKGSLVFRNIVEEVVKGAPEAPEAPPVSRPRWRTTIKHDDIIRSTFWDAHPHILAC